MSNYFYFEIFDKVLKEQYILKVSRKESIREDIEDIIEIVKGEVNPFTAVTNTLRKDVMQKIKEWLEDHDFELLDEERAYTAL